MPMVCRAASRPIRSGPGFGGHTGFQLHAVHARPVGSGADMSYDLSATGELLSLSHSANKPADRYS
jgi:hypothetical protein